jgi:hypothetical protein
MESWADKDTGANRTKLKIVAENWEFVGSKEENF